jgi:hypothetical protein
MAKHLLFPHHGNAVKLGTGGACCFVCVCSMFPFLVSLLCGFVRPAGPVSHLLPRNADAMSECIKEWQNCATAVQSGSVLQWCTVVEGLPSSRLSTASGPAGWRLAYCVSGWRDIAWRTVTQQVARPDCCHSLASQLPFFEEQEFVAKPCCSKGSGPRLLLSCPSRRGWSRTQARAL